MDRPPAKNGRGDLRGRPPADAVAKGSEGTGAESRSERKREREREREALMCGWLEEREATAVSVQN